MNLCVASFIPPVPLLSLLPLFSSSSSFFLSQVNCNHVIKTSTLFSLKLKKKNCGTKSSSVSIKKKEKKIVENACVSPIYRHSLSESQSVAYKGKNAPGAPRTQPGELCWDFPAPEAVNRGPAERDTPGFPPPSCAAEDLRPGLGLT